RGDGFEEPQVGRVERRELRRSQRHDRVEPLDRRPQGLVDRTEERKPRVYGQAEFTGGEAERVIEEPHRLELGSVREQGRDLWRLLLQSHRVVLGCRQGRLNGLEVIFDGRRIGTCYTSCVKDRSLAPLAGELLRREEDLELVLLLSNILLAAEARLLLGEGFSKRLLRVEAVVELGVVLLELFDVPIRV